MTEPQEYTAHQAADPQTPGQVLADIAALRPDLRPVVAGNPSAYPSLLEWLAGLGEPGVDAALRERAAQQASPDAQPTTVLPTAPPFGSAPTAPGYGAPTAGYGAPGAPYGGAPTGAPGYAGGPGYAGAPGQAPAYGYQPTGAPVRKSSNKALWIVLGVIGFLLVLGVVAVIVIRGLISNALPSGDLGSDSDLDALVTQCENEDWAACDQLYMDSPVGSEYEQFGDTCGNRSSGGTYCVEEFGGAAEPSTYGDDSDLDALWDACAGGDGQACDDLYNAAPIGSDYESFGDTCGQTTDGSAPCAQDASSSSANAYGDDPALDALWDACAAGDGQACDDLFSQSPAGSEYEDFGNTCAGTSDGSSWCAAGDAGAEANAYGDDPALDALWDACAAGDGQACDDLFSQAPVGSEYEDFGNTCGGTKDGSSWCAP